MSSTDERVVNMRFNNATFLKAAADTAKSLAAVNKAVDATGNTKGLLDIEGQMGRVAVAASKMQIVAATALGTLANKATNVGLELAKSLTFAPIAQGFSEYGELLTKQNVIMNATGKSAQNVKGYLNELNEYSDKTIYSFSNMTASITKFVNAGVPLPQAVESIQGIANAAAFAGATTEEANRAMYAFSQSMSTGFVMLNDWMQIENANMATMGFKNELLKAGVAAGTLTRKGDGFVTASGKYVSASKGWREGLQEQWATTEVLNTALSKYSDENTKLGRKAAKAATEIRTFGAFMDTLKESLGSGWASIFTALVGNLEEATTMWTGLSGAISPAVSGFFDFLTVAIQTWREMGGFEKTLGGFKNLLAPFAALLGAIGTAWKEAFPGSDSGAGKTLYALSAAFELVTRPLQWLAALITGSTPILTAFFKVIALGGTIVGRIGAMIGNFVKDLLGLTTLSAPGDDGFLGFIKDIAKAVGDAVGQVDDLLKKGASLTEAFGSVNINLPDLPSLPGMPDISLPSVGGDDDGPGKLDALSDGVKDLTGDVKDLNNASQDTAQKGLFSFGDMLSGVGAFLKALGGGIKDILSKFNWEDAVTAFNTAIFATIGFQLIRMMKAFTGITEAMAGFGSLMEGAGGALQSFQTAANAKLILNIGIALLLLAGALWILSTIPGGKLVKALGALAATAFILSKSMSSLSSSVAMMSGKGTGIKMIGLTVMITALAFAMILLATAFLIMNKVDLMSVAKGLVTMFVTMKLMESLGNLGKFAARNMIAGAFAITAIAVSMALLAGALLLFKLVDWDSMLKAGVTLTAVSVAVGLLALLPAASLAGVGAAMLGLGGGMVAMALALIMFAKVEWEDIKKAAVVLGALAIAIAVMMATGGPAGAATILAIGVSMIFLAKALQMLNDVEWASIGKLALVFTVLAVALLAFTGILYLLAPVVPVLALFALALLALGVGMAAFAAAMAIAISLGAAGVAAFAALATGAAIAVAVFLQTLAAEAPIMKEAFLDILQALIDTIVEAVPMIIDGVQRLWEAIKKEFSDGAAKSGSKEGGKSMVTSLGDSIKEKLPLIVQKAKELVVGFFKGLVNKADDIAAAGASLVAALIRGLAKKIGSVVDAAVDLVIEFAKGISKGLVRIVDAGIKLIADFLHKLASAIRGSSGAIGGGLKDLADAFRDVGVDAVKGLIGGLASMAGEALDAMGDLAGSMIKKAKDKFKIFSPSRVFSDIGEMLGLGLAKGVGKSAGAAIVSVASMLTGTIATANELVNSYIQDLDVRAEQARGRADGLARAAQRAADAASKTKTKADDRAAKKLAKEAEKADKKAQKAEQAAEAAAAAEDRKEEFQNASLAEKAEIRSQDAQAQLEAAKAAKGQAAAARAEAAALEKQSKKEGVTEKQRKAMQKEADRLRKEAKEADARAKKLLAAAQGSAVEALNYQNLAGAEFGEALQAQFDQEARADQEAEEFEKLSNAEKAAKRRADAAKLEAAAQKALADAKALAFTDLEAANALAEEALAMADLARQYIDDAEGYEGSGGGSSINLQPTEAAAIAYNDYADLYDAAYAAASGQTVQFNQYNTSPESLSTADIYRQSNNLVNFAANQLQTAA